MPVTILESCGCCGDVGGFPTCAACEAAVTAINAFFSGFQDGPSCCNGGVCLHSPLNGGWHVPLNINNVVCQAGIGVPTVPRFFMPIGTQGDYGDPGILLQRCPTPFGDRECFAYGISGSATCSGGSGWCVGVGICTHSFLNGVLNGSCNNSPLLNTPGLGPGGCVGGDGRLNCEQNTPVAWQFQQGQCDSCAFPGVSYTVTAGASVEF